MGNLINSVNKGYTVANAGLKQEDVQATLAKSKQVAADNFESNSAVKTMSGAASADGVNNTLRYLPAVWLVDKALEQSISKTNSKGLLSRAAKFGDKISDTFHLEKFLSTEKTSKISNFIKNNRFTKYFTNDFKAIPKSSMAKSRNLAQELFEQVPTEVSERLIDLTTNYNLIDAMKNGDITLSNNAVKALNALATNADDAIASMPKEEVTALADELISKGLGTKKLSNLMNKLNASELKTGNSLFGKLLAKGTLKTKNTLTFGGGLLSLFFTASAIAQAVKATKEAPKGEKKATFMHVMSEQYLGMILFQPSINLLYKAGGNKYRGMTKEERQALTELVNNANRTIDSTKIAQMQQKLLKKGADVNGVKSMTGKSLAEAKKIANSLNGGGFIGKTISTVLHPIKTLGKLLQPKGEISDLAKETISEIAKQTKANQPMIKETAKVAKLQSELLLKGVDKDKVADLTGKGVKEAKKLAKAMKKDGAKLKFWEKPLKFAGKLLDTGLDTIKSPTKMGKAGSKIKGFAGGFARFALIMFVIQPFIQKPITKLCHKIFGEPKTYLAKQNAEKGSQNEQPKQTQNTTSATPQNSKGANQTSTNLLEQWRNKQNPTQNQTVSVQSNALPASQIAQNTQEAISAKKIADNKKTERYIPSIEVSFADDSSALDKQAEAILKSTESVMASARKFLQ